MAKKSDDAVEDVPAQDAAPAADAAPVAEAPLVPFVDESIKSFVVTPRGGEASGVIEARDALEAWAKYCDAVRSWPGSASHVGATVQQV